MVTLLAGLAILAILFGVAGLVVPGLPDVPLIFLGIWLYAHATGYATLPPQLVAGLGSLAAACLVMESATGAVRGRRNASTRAGRVGLALGAAVGAAAFGWAGLAAGALLGAVAGEAAAGRSAGEAFRVGLGSLASLGLGYGFKLLVAAVMVTLFIFRVS